MMKAYGPVQERIRQVEYANANGKLPDYRYDYPDGSYEQFSDFGEYFGVHWTANPNLDEFAAATLFVEIVEEELSPGAEEFECTAGNDYEREIRLLSRDDLYTYFDDLVLGHEKWTVDCLDGTFYWERLRDGSIIAGVLTYNGAPTEPIAAWQRATAAEAIVTRGAFTPDRLPSERAL